MRGFNQVTIAGNIGRDPELRVTANGNSVLKFSVGVTDDFDKDHTEWFNVVIFGKFAESMEKVLEKGKAVLISGKLKTNTYEKDGEKKYFTELLCDRLVLCGDGGGSDSRGDDRRGNDRNDRGRRDDRRGNDRRNNDRGGSKSRDDRSDEGENPFRPFR